MSPLRKATEVACASALKPYGFVKRKGPFLRPHGDGVMGWLGLNAALMGLPEEMLINPVVGVRHERLEELRQALGQRGQVSAPTPSVSRPLGYLMPEKDFRQWEFRADKDVTPIAEDLATNVEDYGRPFIDQWGDWDVFAAEIEDSGLLLTDETFSMLPIVWALNGEVARAHERMAAGLERMEGRGDPQANDYRQFASRFEAMFG